MPSIPQPPKSSPSTSGRSRSTTPSRVVPVAPRTPVKASPIPVSRAKFGQNVNYGTAARPLPLGPYTPQAKAIMPQAGVSNTVTPGANGNYYPDRGAIAVQPGLNPGAAASVLRHEYNHFFDDRYNVAQTSPWNTGGNLGQVVPQMFQAYAQAQGYAPAITPFLKDSPYQAQLSTYQPGWQNYYENAAEAYAYMGQNPQGQPLPEWAQQFYPQYTVPRPPTRRPVYRWVRFEDGSEGPILIDEQSGNYWPVNR